MGESEDAPGLVHGREWEVGPLINNEIELLQRKRIAPVLLYVTHMTNRQLILTNLEIHLRS